MSNTIPLNIRLNLTGIYTDTINYRYNFNTNLGSSYTTLYIPTNYSLTNSNGAIDSALIKHIPGKSYSLERLQNLQNLFLNKKKLEHFLYINKKPDRSADTNKIMNDNAIAIISLFFLKNSPFFVRGNRFNVKSVPNKSDISCNYGFIDSDQKRKQLEKEALRKKRFEIVINYDKLIQSYKHDPRIYHDLRENRKTEIEKEYNDFLTHNSGNDKTNYINTYFEKQKSPTWL